MRSGSERLAYLDWKRCAQLQPATCCAAAAAAGADDGSAADGDDDDDTVSVPCCVQHSPDTMTLAASHSRIYKNYEVTPSGSLYRSRSGNFIIFTAQCTLVQSAVLQSHVIRLSVRR